MNTTANVNCSSDIGLLLMRGALAVVFIYHGGQILFGLFGGYGLEGTARWMATVGIPIPNINALLSGLIQFGGAIILILGTGTRIVALPMALNMFVALLVVHRHSFDVRSGGLEYALTLCVVLVALSLIGPGRFTVTRLLPRIRSQHQPQPA